ncbi:ABC-2 type transport system permease protein [Thermoactinomyces sp. DSM 45891]|uniref:ABC transporter permease n=1 Tax=Thermoactinomyces sp. DSM 45891 TaxID=1761907 RepID=UPI0009209E6C|nr:ABC transporter permease [Thermoactinomyces sp. DSM 45891]SFX09137.1 ABC-2 type transport system permease protein [Thermoactinomyces sp. DSM 45891]
MIGLVYNEMLKMVRKKRLWVILGILVILIPIFTYAQAQTLERAAKQIGTSDWKVVLKQQIIDQQNRLTSSRLPEEWKAFIKLNIQQQEYYLKNDINPTAPGAPTFMRKFVEESVSLFLPLLVVIIAADLVSSEHSSGTIKLLLTRPVRRWKVLLSKYISLLFATSFIVLSTAILSYLLSGVIFGYGGWDLPVLSGFQEKNGALLTEFVHLIPQWKYLLMAYGLSWLACITVATVSFMVSVLVRSTASGMGIMLAAVISGNLLMQLSPTWGAIKYFAFTQLRLTDYLSGRPILIEGMTLPLSIGVLGAWSVVALIIAFVTFSRRDVLA